MDFKKADLPVESIDRWFMREVYVWRKAGSIFWYIISLLPLTFVYVLTANTNVFHLIQSFTDIFTTLFSWSFYVSVVFILIINGVVAGYSSNYFTVQPEVGETRLKNLLALVKVSRLVHLGVLSGCGLVLAWCCSSFIGKRYSNLTLSPDGHVVNLNEHHLFFVLYGLYLGVGFYCRFYLILLNYLEFPLIQREKFFQVRSIAGSILLYCMKQTLREIRYYYLLYYLFGSTPKGWIVYNLNLQLSLYDAPLDSVFGLLNFSLLLEVFVFGVFINYSWSLFVILFKVYQTEHYMFPIEGSFDSQVQRYLHDALNCNQQLLIKYLGYLDLCSVAKFCPERRKQIFCLSQPGGHPHAWNRVSSACLAEINDLCAKIEAANWKAYAGVPVKLQQPIVDKTFSDKTYTIGNETNDSVFYRTASFQSVSFTNGNTGNTDTVSDIPPKTTITIWKEKFSALVSKKPVIGYFMGELADSKSRQLFASSQIHIWAVEALSDLVSASYTEDAYGIVQRSLPTILSSLLSLQENVEKHFKLVAPVTRRNSKDVFTVNDAMLRYQLQTVLKSSIYRIINRFGKHIRELPMDADAFKKLRPFLEYKE